MKRMMTMVMVAGLAGLMLASLDADAKRLGGGRSFGSPRDSVTQRQATPPAAAPAPAPAGPTSAAAPTRAPTAAPPAAAPQPGWKRWLGPVAGIAAGLGIAALMSHLGLSEGFGTFLLIALAIFAAVIVFRMLFRRPQPQAQNMQYAGAGPARGEPTFGSPAPASSPMFGGAARATPDAEPFVASPKSYPPGFEPEPFLRQAKLNFTALQAAYDKADTASLRDVMTPDMFAEISRDLAARGAHQPTEIVTLNAEILEVTTERDMHWASVRFTGLVREDGATIAEPLDEVWNLQKPVSGDHGWMLAGIQQLEHQ